MNRDPDKPGNGTRQDPPPKPPPPREKPPFRPPPETTKKQHEEDREGKSLEEAADLDFRLSGDDDEEF